MSKIARLCGLGKCFSALQRAEIAEIPDYVINLISTLDSFSALQRAEIAEIYIT